MLSTLALSTLDETLNDNFCFKNPQNYTIFLITKSNIYNRQFSWLFNWFLFYSLEYVCYAAEISGVVYEECCSYLLPALQGSVYSVDGILADIKCHWIHKHIHIKRGVLGATGCCSLGLKYKWISTFGEKKTFVKTEELCKKLSSTCNRHGCRSWRCVKFRYSNSLQSSWEEKLNSWQWRGP